MTQRQVNEILTTKEGARNALARMQELRILTYEEIPLIEEKRRELKEVKRSKEKGKEVLASSKKSNPVQTSLIERDPDPDLNRAIWEQYKESYLDRYRVEPVRNAKVNTNISQIAKRLGPEAIDVVRFYLTHDKTFYVGKMHDIGLCLADAEALRTQWLKGKAVTNTDLKNFERNQGYAEVERLAREGKL